MATTQQVSGGLIDRINTQLENATPEELLLLAKALQLTAVPSSVQDLMDLLYSEKEEGLAEIKELTDELTNDLKMLAEKLKSDLEQKDRSSTNKIFAFLTSFIPKFKS
jgi:hypothetical protein